MSDNMRWRYGDTAPIMAAVDSAQVLEIGDLLWQNTDDARPASQHAWTGLNASQEAFVNNFLGVGMQRSRNADTDPVRIATTGVFEFSCASATFELGDLVGPDDNAGATALEDQKVIAVTDAARAIGRVAKRQASAGTTVYVEIRSTIMLGGPQSGIASA